LLKLLLWPFWLTLRLVEAIIKITGRFLAIILGLIVLFFGITLCVTIIGVVFGIPLVIVGLGLIIRGLF